MQVILIISSFSLAPNGNIYSSTASLTLPYTVDCGVVRLKGHNMDSNSTRLSLNSSPNGLKSYIFFSNFQPLYSYHTISISKSICPYWQGTRRSVMYVSSTGLDSSWYVTWWTSKYISIPSWSLARSCIGSVLWCRFITALSLQNVWHLAIITVYQQFLLFLFPLHIILLGKVLAVYWQCT